MSSLPVESASSSGQADSAANGNNSGDYNRNGDNNNPNRDQSTNNQDSTTITTTDNNRFRLPSVLIQYEDGSSQNLTIEVGPRNSRNRTTTNNSLEEFYSALQNSPVTPRDYVQDLRNRIESSNSTQRSNSVPSASQEREGIRGLDYPAFDVSREGVYREPSNPVSSLAVDNTGHNSNNNDNNNDTNNETETNNSENESNNRRPTSSTSSTFSSGDFFRHFLLPFQRSLERNRALHNTNASSADRSSTSTDLTSHSTTEEHATIPSTGSSSNDITDDTRTSRNIILTVNYIYGQGEITQANSLNENSDGNMSGSLILNVPNISGGDSESLQVLIRLATTIALRTIATSVKKATGISSEAFTTLKTLKLDSLPPAEKSCPICYDDYLEVVDEDEDEEEEDEEVEEAVRDDGEFKEGSNRGKKRRITHDTKSRPKKKTKLTSESSSANTIDTPNTNENANSNTSTGTSNKKPTVPNFTHVAVAMPCGHIFGRSCLYEWLKANNSCPLCRDDIKKQKSFQQFVNNGEMVSNQAMTERTITLPNLASVISQGRENIDDFGSRNLTFIMTDQDQQEHQLEINGEFNSPLVIAPSVNSERESNVNNNMGDGIGSLRENLNTLRGLLESVSRGGTGTRLREGSASALNTNRALRRITRSHLGDSNIRRRSSNNNTNRLINQDPLFPIGVESRRVANGVETREILADDTPSDSLRNATARSEGSANNDNEDTNGASPVGETHDENTA